MLLFCLSLIDTEEKRSRFGEIYLAYRQDMFRLANSILNNEHDAEDAVEDVFIKIAIKHVDFITDITSETDLRNYLLKSTKHTVYNICDLHANRNVSLDVLMEAGASMPELTDDSFLEYVLSKMDYEKVLRIMNRLDEKYRYVLYEHFVLGRTLPAIASDTNQNLTTVKKQLQRGKKLIIAAFENNERSS